MSDQPNIFKGNVDRLTGVDIDVPAKTVPVPSCEYFPDRYDAAAKSAEAAEKTQEAAIYQFLSILVGFHPNFDAPDAPFGPWIQIEGRRSAIPSDLTATDISALKELAPLATNVALRSRLFDLTWELTKDHKACTQAAEAYIQSANQLNTSEHWVYARTHYQRALQLAGKLGRKKDLFLGIADAVMTAARNAANEKEDFWCCQFLQLIQRYGCGEPTEFAEIAERIAQAASNANNPYKARAYWLVAADLRKNARSETEATAAQLAAAETYVVEAEKRASGENGSALAATSLLLNGIEALRRASAPQQRISELRKNLTEYQRKSLAEMKTFSSSVDISEAIESAQDYVKQSNFPDAIIKFALGRNLTDLKELKETVIKTAQNFLANHLFDSAIVDSQGRVIKQKPSLLHLQGEEYEAQLKEEMFSHASHFMWSLRVSSYISPARVQIYNDHHPNLDDLLFLVSNNPFIPPGHEGIFLRGIHAGFHGNFLVASHLLVPQIENSLRYVLESQNVDVSNLMSDGTQPVKVLGAIFDIEETRKIFGDSLWFELRGCLIEKSGYDFRNRLCHGFISEGDCYSVAGEMVWWLVLRICLLPIYQAYSAASDGAEDVDMPHSTDDKN